MIIGAQGLSLGLSRVLGFGIANWGFVGNKGIQYIGRPSKIGGCRLLGFRRDLECMIYMGCVLP